MTTNSRSCLALTVAALAFACAAHPVASPPVTAEHRFAGRVLRADGAPSSGAVVIVTDPENGDVLSTVRASKDGGFATNLRPGVYGVTATDPEQSVYQPSIDGRGRLVEIRVDADCHGFEGRIRTEARLPQEPIVQLRRVSDLAGDIFGAAVAADGTFRACVPAAMYGVIPPQGLASRNVYVDIPFARKFEYRTDLQQETDRVPTDLSGLAPDSLDAFVAAFPASTRVLGLGETNHGTREFYDERTALLKRLATKHGVRLLMLEAGTARSSQSMIA